MNTVVFGIYNHGDISIIPSSMGKVCYCYSLLIIRLHGDRIRDYRHKLTVIINNIISFCSIVAILQLYSIAIVKENNQTLHCTIYHSVGRQNNR